MSNESTKKTLLVTIVLALVCSILVSVAVVALRPYKEKNIQLDLQKNILSIAGLSKNVDLLTTDEISALYKNVQPQLVDLKKGVFVNESEDVIEAYDQKLASKDSTTSRSVPQQQDIAKINRQANIAKVYLIKKEGRSQSILLPLHGYGLWSTMYGFIALDIQDLNTVIGFGFYSQGETPGLGGEVDNPLWRAAWPGKKVFNQNNEIALRLIKGSVDPKDKAAQYKVDGLAGATLTSKGVSNFVQFWLGEHGFLPFLNNLKAGEAK